MSTVLSCVCASSFVLAPGSSSTGGIVLGLSPFEGASEMPKLGNGSGLADSSDTRGIVLERSSLRCFCCVTICPNLSSGSCGGCGSEVLLLRDAKSLLSTREALLVWADSEARRRSEVADESLRRPTLGLPELRVRRAGRPPGWPPGEGGGRELLILVY